MTNMLGPHLLGRNVPPPDDRDFRLGNFMGLGHGPVSRAGRTLDDPAGMIDLASQEFKLTTVTFKKWAATRYQDVTTTHWWRGFDYLARAKAALGDTPAHVTSWPDPEPTLDQADTPHCVGFAGAQWGNTLPIDDKFGNTDGHALYYECKVLDGEPGEENGSYGRSLAQALLNRGRLRVYAFAADVDEMLAWVSTTGPLFIGSWWSNSMFNVDADGLVVPDTDYAGGHEYVLKGWDPATQRIEFLNSWGAGWGQAGKFYIDRDAYETLWLDQGDAVAAVELPL